MKKSIRGFTLVELLVTLSVVTLLASLVFAGLDQAKKVSQNSKVLNDINQIQLALQLYYQDHGYYPACNPSNTSGDTQTCCIGTSICYDDQNNTYYGDLFKTVTALNSAGQSLPDSSGNLAAAYWPQLMGKIRQEGYIYSCTGLEVDPSTNLSVCPSGSAVVKYAADIIDPTSDTVVILTIPAGNTDIACIPKSVPENAFSATTDECMQKIYGITQVGYNSPGGGCPYPTDPNYNSDALYTSVSYCQNSNTPGILPNGEVCTDKNQCQSGFCDLNLGNGYSSGKCADSNPGVASNFCYSSSQCTNGLFCSTVSHTCTSYVYGCTYSNATNYNPSANSDDGSCQYNNGSSSGSSSGGDSGSSSSNSGSSSSYTYVYGCTDSNATNYNPSANSDDGSCQYSSGSSSNSGGGSNGSSSDSGGSSSDNSSSSSYDNSGSSSDSGGSSYDSGSSSYDSGSSYNSSSGTTYCTDNSQCPSLYCDTNYWTCSDNSSSSSSDSGSSSSGAGLGSWCYYDSDCLSNYCYNNYCADAGGSSSDSGGSGDSGSSSSGAGLGSWCYSDSDCQSNYCYSNYCADAGGSSSSSSDYGYQCGYDYYYTSYTCSYDCSYDPGRGYICPAYYGGSSSS